MTRGTRVWTCDGCGKRETWRKGWGYLYGIESPANSPDANGLLYPLAGCSEECVNNALDKLVASLPVPKWLE